MNVFWAEIKDLKRTAMLLNMYSTIQTLRGNVSNMIWKAIFFRHQTLTSCSFAALWAARIISQVFESPRKFWMAENLVKSVAALVCRLLLSTVCKFYVVWSNSNACRSFDRKLFSSGLRHRIEVRNWQIWSLKMLTYKAPELINAYQKHWKLL